MDGDILLNASADFTLIFYLFVLYIKSAFEQGCGGGLVVSVLAFYSDDPSSIPAEVYNFFCKIVVEKDENKQKEAGVGPIF